MTGSIPPLPTPSPPTIPTTIHNRFFHHDATRFQIRGMVYQTHERLPRSTGVSDPLRDQRLPSLRRDISLFHELGVNTLVIYSIDNTLSHNAAMTLLAEAGIYVIVGLSTPKKSINRADSGSSYTPELMEAYFRTVDEMARYPNTLALCAANSVINNVETTRVAEVMRSVVRDLKRYMALQSRITGQRVLPVGMTLVAGVRVLLKNSVEYFAAGRKEERVDYLGLTSYEWVGRSDMQRSGWDGLVRVMERVRLPCFLAEYGAKAAGSRGFEEVSALYGVEMKRVFSGGALYEFYAGANGYGIVREKAVGEEIEKLEEYEKFMGRMEGFKMAAEQERSVSNDDDGWEEVKFPEIGPEWKASCHIPDSPIDWEQMEKRIRSSAET